MTNQEAKEWIIEHWGNDLEDGTKQSEAVKVAIKALEAWDNVKAEIDTISEEEI